MTSWQSKVAREARMFASGRTWRGRAGHPDAKRWGSVWHTIRPVFPEVMALFERARIGFQRGDKRMVPVGAIEAFMRLRGYRSFDLFYAVFDIDDGDQHGFDREELYDEYLAMVSRGPADSELQRELALRGLAG